MTALRMLRIAVAVLLVGLMLPQSDADAAPQPGDVYREYHWRPDGKWQRVTGPETKEPRAIRFLPNSVNHIEILDVDGAVKAEAYIEKLLCHGGTIDKRMRVNGNDWLRIPEAPLIPGIEYQYMRYPTVAIPLDQLARGDNTFEFTCSGGKGLGSWWPQWILYGVTFRIYYGPDKAHAGGSVVAQVGDSTLGENPVFEAQVTGDAKIKQVDFIGLYEDFNWEGDGEYRQWHYRTLFGEIANHMGTATAAPYQVTWNTRWIPDQAAPISVIARIVDETNLCYLTPAVDGLKLERARRVVMCKPYDVPPRWSTRANKTHQCKVDVPDLAGAAEAQIVMSTWNGVAADEIGVNGKKVIQNLGQNHDLSYDAFPVPLELLQKGENTLYTASATEHHGIEVQWPGMVLMIAYE